MSDEVYKGNLWNLVKQAVAKNKGTSSSGQRISCSGSGGSSGGSCSISSGLTGVRSSSNRSSGDGGGNSSKSSKSVESVSTSNRGGGGNGTMAAASSLASRPVRPQKSNNGGDTNDSHVLLKAFNKYTKSLSSNNPTEQPGKKLNRFVLDCLRFERSLGSDTSFVEVARAAAQSSTALRNQLQAEFTAPNDRQLRANAKRLYDALGSEAKASVFGILAHKISNRDAATIFGSNPTNIQRYKQTVAEAPVSSLRQSTAMSRQRAPNRGGKASNAVSAVEILATKDWIYKHFPPQSGDKDVIAHIDRALPEFYEQVYRPRFCEILLDLAKKCDWKRPVRSCMHVLYAHLSHFYLCMFSLKVMAWLHEFVCPSFFNSFFPLKTGASA